MDDALTIGAIVAFVGALMGNRTAIALLCSLLAARGVEVLVLPVKPDVVDPLLVVIDLAVLRVVVRPNMGLADELICALFLVAWLGVGAHWIGFDETGWLRRDATAACVVLQLLLCLPIGRLQRGLKEFSHGPRRGTAHEGA